MLSQGILDATFLYPTGGAEAVDAAVKLLHGEKVPKKIVPATRAITKENPFSSFERWACNSAVKIMSRKLQTSRLGRVIRRLERPAGRLGRVDRRLSDPPAPGFRRPRRLRHPRRLRAGVLRDAGEEPDPPDRLHAGGLRRLRRRRLRPAQRHRGGVRHLLRGRAEPVQFDRRGLCREVAGGGHQRLARHARAVQQSAAAPPRARIFTRRPRCSAASAAPRPS